MRRIEFIEPVDAMRGNLSGKQDLRYPESDNKAYDAPNGKVYARNYTPRYIGAKVAKSGLKYFAVKTKTATVLNATTRQTLAILGSVAAIRHALMQDAAKWAQIMAICTAKVVAIVAGGGKATQYSVFFDICANALREHKDIVFASGGSSVSVGNPYRMNSSVNTILEIKTETFIKFGPQLAYDNSGAEIATGGAHFYVNGVRLFAYNDGDGVAVWGDIIGSVANPSLQTAMTGFSTEDDKVTYNGDNILLNGSTVADASRVVANAKYITE